MNIKAKHAHRSKRSFNKVIFKSKDMAKHDLITPYMPKFKHSHRRPSLEDRGFTFDECEEVKKGKNTYDKAKEEIGKRFVSYEQCITDR